MASPIIRSERVTLGERNVRFKLFRVPRRRHVHVLVNDEGQLEVRAPWRFSIDEARAAIYEHGQWVLEALDASRTQIRMRPKLVSGASLPLLDDRLRLRVENQAQLTLFDEPDHMMGRSGSVHRAGSALVVRLARLTPSAVRGLLEQWYREQAQSLLPQRLAPHAQALGVRFSRVSVRAQRARWGSCSSEGALSLNWRLLLLPTRLCDYVLVHELCHLKEMNHSPAFWQLVASRVPNYMQLRRELDRVTHSLVL